MQVEPLFSPCWPRQLHSLGCCCLRSTPHPEPAVRQCWTDKQQQLGPGCLWCICPGCGGINLAMADLRCCEDLNWLSMEVRPGADVQFKRGKSQGRIFQRQFICVSQGNTILLIYTKMLHWVWIQLRILWPTGGLKMLNHHFAPNRVVFIYLLCVRVVLCFNGK